MTMREEYLKYREDKKAVGGGTIFEQTFNAGYMSRQPEIDALKAEVEKLKEENEMFEGLTTTMANEILDLENKKS